MPNYSQEQLDALLANAQGEGFQEGVRQEREESLVTIDVACAVLRDSGRYAKCSADRDCANAILSFLMSIQDRIASRPWPHLDG